MVDAVRPTGVVARDRTGRAGPGEIATPTTRSRPATVALAVPKVPAHVVTMLGISVAGYGLALALVTGLQSTAEAAITADRAPLGAALDDLNSGHARLESELLDVARTYALAAADYGSAADGVGSLDERLAALAASVKKVDGASRALPASVALPPVVRSVRPATTRATTHATSGGSAAP